MNPHLRIPLRTCCLRRLVNEVMGTNNQASIDETAEEPAEEALATTPSDVPVVPQLNTRLDKISQIVHWMITGEWQRGDKDLPRECARVWGHTVGTIHQLADQANNHRELLKDKDKVVEALQKRLWDIAHEDKPDRVQAINSNLKSMGRDGSQIFAKHDSKALITDPKIRSKVVASWANPDNLWTGVIEEAIRLSASKGGGLVDIIERTLNVRLTPTIETEGSSDDEP